jgi:hypothetical protein
VLKRIASKDECALLLPDDAELFYSMSLLGDNGKIIWETQTHWVGFSDRERLIEIRKPRKVNARLARIWTDIAQPFFVIRSIEDAEVFGAFGGHALISPEVFETIFSAFLEPFEALQDGVSGFSGLDSFDKSAFKRVPSPKLRMAILNRDGRRCRICGRKPDDHLDMELHVHHIRPWAKGGPTSMKNLLTLCNTCHKGLHPHYDPTLYTYSDPDNSSSDLTMRRKKYVQGVLEYQKIVRGLDEET